MECTSVHGPDDAFDLEDGVSLVRDYFVASLHSFEVDYHGRPVCALLKHTIFISMVQQTKQHHSLPQNCHELTFSLLLTQTVVLAETA